MCCSCKRTDLQTFRPFPFPPSLYVSLPTRFTLSLEVSLTKIIIADDGKEGRREKTTADAKEDEIKRKPTDGKLKKVYRPKERAEKTNKRQRARRGIKHVQQSASSAEQGPIRIDGSRQPDNVGSDIISSFSGNDHNCVINDNLGPIFRTVSEIRQG